MKIEGNFSVKCKCGKLHPFDAEEADFDAVSTNGETGYKWNIDFDCGRCGNTIVVDYNVFESKGKIDRQDVKVYSAELQEKYVIQ